MRALSLLLVLVLGFVLVLKFYPRSDEALAADLAAEDPGLEEAQSRGAVRDEEAEEVRFLARPERALPEIENERVGTLAAPPADLEAVPNEGTRAWMVDVQRQIGTRAEARVGEALLRGGTADLIGAIEAGGDEIDVDWQAAVLSFCDALAGDRRGALDRLEGARLEGLGSTEELLREALSGAEDGLDLAPLSREGPIVLAMGMRLVDRRVREHQARGAHAEAAAGLSQLLMAELDAPWTADPIRLAEWSSQLHAAQEKVRWNPRAEWPHEVIEVESGDSLTVIRKRYLSLHPQRRLCTGLIERANRIRGYIRPGQKLRIPTDPVSVLVDLRARWVLYFHGSEVVASWQVGIGRAGEETITGDFVTGDKLENPMWFPPGEAPIAFGDVRNPLGTRWIEWFQDGQKTSYGFHGTKDPASIGQAASDGCIRFHNADVEALFEILPRGAPIHVRG